jgi:hypothetical protein
MKETRILRNVVVWDNKLKQRVEIDVDVEVDLHWIGQQLAAKAYNNKSQNNVRRTRALHGLVEVRVRGTKALPIRVREDA